MENNRSKLSDSMSDVEIARWSALIEALEIIFKHADKHNIDIENLNLDTRKLLKEYVDPISGDILYNLKRQKNKMFAL